jgi:hypothetical protein
MMPERIMAKSASDFSLPFGRRVRRESEVIEDKVADFDQHEHDHADEQHEERLLVIEERTPDAKQCQKHHNYAKDNAKKTSEAFDEAKCKLIQTTNVVKFLSIVLFRSLLLALPIMIWNTFRSVGCARSDAITHSRCFEKFSPFFFARSNNKT